MPIPHRNGLIRHDRPLSSQAYAMHAVLAGFGATIADPAATAPLGADHPEAVLAGTIALLLEPSVAPDEPAIAAAADATIAIFRETRDAVLGLIERSQTLGQ